MNAFFIIAGIVVTVLGVAALSVILGIYISVKYFGLTVRLENHIEQDTNQIEDDNT